MNEQRLASRVVQYSQLRDRVFRDFFSTESNKKIFANPVVTVSREPGSGGKLIAQELAKRLKYTFYDKQIIEEIAESAKLRTSVLERIDEHKRTAVQDLIQSLLNPDYVSDLTYFKHLSRVILAIGAKGNAVILGRGANFILPFEKGLHIRVTAPYSTRVERAVQYEGKTLEDARETVKKFDKARKQFVEQYFGRKMRRASYYDLVLNTEILSIEDCVEIALSAFARKFPSDRAKG